MYYSIYIFMQLLMILSCTVCEIKFLCSCIMISNMKNLKLLKVLRPSDVKVAHNKIVAQCRAALQSNTPLPLVEVVKQLEGLAKTAGEYFYGEMAGSKSTI